MRLKQKIYLSQDAGPTIRYLLGCHESLKELLALEAVGYWLQVLPDQLGQGNILGSGDTCLENAMGKLLSFGLRKDQILSKNLQQSCLSIVNKKSFDTIYDSLERQVVATYLLASGLKDEEVMQIVSDRVETLYNSVTGLASTYDIYVTDKVSKQDKSKKFVKADLYRHSELALPLIHDLYLFGLVDGVDQSMSDKIDSICDFIADDKYQSLDYGYGLVKTMAGKSHAMGWSAHLPLYNDHLSNDYFLKGLIHRMLIVSKLRNHKMRSWLQSMIMYLDKFKIDDYRYFFPSVLLPEYKNSYYMNGRHTGLNENRRTKKGRIIESTYYMYQITDNMDK